MSKIQNVNVSIDKLKELKCACEKGIFVLHFRLRQIPAFMSPNGQDTILQIPTYNCIVCGAELQIKK